MQHRQGKKLIELFIFKIQKWQYISRCYSDKGLKPLWTGIAFIFIKWHRFENTSHQFHQSVGICSYLRGILYLLIRVWENSCYLNIWMQNISNSFKIGKQHLTKWIWLQSKKIQNEKKGRYWKVNSKHQMFEKFFEIGKLNLENLNTRNKVYLILVKHLPYFHLQIFFSEELTNNGTNWF